MGKTVFVSNALPGETVETEIVCTHRSFDEAKATSVLSREKSSSRYPQDVNILGNAVVVICSIFKTRIN